MGPDSAQLEGRGCYTSVRIAAGRPRFEAQHLRRLERGAEALALGHFDPRAASRLLRDLARELSGGEGAVRLQISRDANGLRLIGIPRGLGVDPPVWRAIRAPQIHEPPPLPGGHKLCGRLLFALATDAARAAGADEALLFDREGRLVEGARSNLVIVDAQERLLTPPLERGAVAGVALEVLRERVSLLERDITPAGLRAARALFALNAVRGVRPIVRLDAATLRSDQHAFASTLRDALERD